MCEKKLTEKGLATKTQDYFNVEAIEQAVEEAHVEQGTDMSTYLAEKRDDALVYSEMKDKLSKKTDSAKKLFSRVKGKFIKKKK
jgi:hypothetical protein